MPISASLRPGNTASFEEMSQQWRAVGNTVSDFTGPRIEPQTSRSRDEHVTARSTGRLPNNLLLLPAQICCEADKIKPNSVQLNASMQ